MPIEIWLAFVVASAVLLIIPGPTILTVISYSNCPWPSRQCTTHCCRCAWRFNRFGGASARPRRAPDNFGQLTLFGRRRRFVLPALILPLIFGLAITRLYQIPRKLWHFVAENPLHAYLSVAVYVGIYPLVYIAARGCFTMGSSSLKNLPTEEIKCV